MIKSALCTIVILALLTGCTTYQYTTIKELEHPLDPTKGILVATPADGWFENTQHHNSGNMTGHAVFTAFKPHALPIKRVKSHDTKKLLSTVDSEKYGYLALPKIQHWEERATEWSWADPQKL